VDICGYLLVLNIFVINHWRFPQLIHFENLQVFNIRKGFNFYPHYPPTLLLRLKIYI